MNPIVDKFGRPIRDLRISVTDRCNFRCTYCMPKEIFGDDYVFLPKSELLSFEEMERFARLICVSWCEEAPADRRRATHA